MASRTREWHVASVHNPSPHRASQPSGTTEDPLVQPPTARDVPITSTLIAVNVLIFALEEFWGDSESVATLLRMGAIYPGSPELFQWGSFVSYGYLHIGALHLGVNMFALWNMGRLLEPLLGRSRFFVLYTLSLLGGGLAISLSPNPHITAGASGALFGLLGAVCALLYRRYRTSRYPDERSGIRSSIGRLLLPNLLISLLPGVSLLGHAGGLLVGGTFAALLFKKPSNLRVSQPDPSPSKGLSVTALLLLVLTIASIASVWSAFTPWVPAANPAATSTRDPI